MRASEAAADCLCVGMDVGKLGTGRNRMGATRTALFAVRLVVKKVAHLTAGFAEVRPECTASGGPRWQLDWRRRIGRCFNTVGDT